MADYLPLTSAGRLRWGCTHCGAVVWEKEQHDEWHDAQAVIARMAAASYQPPQED
jgi:hypothetical protein